LEELKKAWGEAGSSKIALLGKEQQEKNDLLSILINQMSGNPQDERKGRDAVLDRVRSENYSIKHFLMEVACLENVLMSLAKSLEVQPLEALNDIRKNLGALLRAIVQETWGVYEQVLESGARGFCLFKADGTIVTTNEAMNRILDTRSAAGKPLASFFNPPERALLQQILSMEKASKRGCSALTYAPKGAP
jgi:PAS domain-containing protein